MTQTTPAQAMVGELRALLEKATPGEWRIQAGSYDSYIASDCGGGDIVACPPDGDMSFACWEDGTMQFIVAAHNHMEALLDLIESLSARAAGVEGELREALEDMCHQFAYDGTSAEGPVLTTGGLSALEGAFAVLGWSDPYPIPGAKCETDGCAKRATSGTPTDAGYKRLCGEHFVAILASLKGEGL